MTTYKELVEQSAMGDEEATLAVGDRLAQLDELIERDKQRQELGTVEQARAELEQFKRNSAVLNAWRLQNPHIAADEEKYARMTAIDTELFNNPRSDYSTLPFARRLQIAEEIAEKELGSPETRHVSEDIQAAAGRRAYIPHGPVEEVSDEQLALSEGVAELIAERRRLHEQMGEKIGRRPEDNPQRRRAAPWSAGGPQYYRYDRNGNRIE